MWLVIAAIAFGAQADTVRNPLANNPSAAVAGRRLYDQACQSCHGSAGQGDRGPALNGFTFTYGGADADRSEEHTSELQSRFDLVCRLLLEKKKKKIAMTTC